jgi:hypothetical protein
MWRIIVFGGLIGGIIAAWIAPRMISWYFTPPVEFGINCKPPLEWALRKMQIAELLGITLGAALGLVVYFLIRKMRKPELSGLPES